MQSVPADEGFWEDGPGQRVWVHLAVAGTSPCAVRAGDRVSVDGRIVASTPGGTEGEGLTPAEGADELRATEAYVEVPRATLVVER